MKLMSIFWWSLAIVLALVYFASTKQQYAVTIVPSQVVLNASAPGEEVPFEFAIRNNSRKPLTLLAIPSPCS
ncbi:MAG: hypothetical protein KatS3mg111_1469 [Pirellulaceae bacterium]|nr:MAG: hypothetical protein KatS3mg111_1469 [Pirellulaceae bacterium]